MNKLRLLAFYYLPVLVWMGLIFYLSSVPNLELSGELSAYDLVLRKIAHVVEYAILSVLLGRSLGYPVGNQPLGLKWIWVVGIGVAYAISDELHQHFTPTRDGKVVDVLIDSVGVVLGVWLYGFQQRYQMGHFDHDRE